MAGQAKRAAEIVIDRARWLRGDADSSMLLRSDGKMCCLGFAGRALGIAPEKLLQEASPETVSAQAAQEWPDWMLVRDDDADRDRDSRDTDALIRINDNPEIPEAEREANIIAIFAKHGVTVRFVDGGAVSP